MFTPNQPHPHCESCAAVTPVESLELSYGQLICPACFEGRAFAAIDTSREDEFQWVSHNWFRLSYLERLPFNSRAERFYK